MSLLLRGKAGQIANLGSGVEADVRLSHLGAMVVQELHGRFAEQAMRGNLYFASNAAAGVAPGTAISNSPPFALYNPDGSNKLLVVLAAWMGFISGTLGAGTIFYTNTTAKGAAPASGALTVKNAYLGQSPGQGAAYTAVALASTPTILRPMCSTGALVTSTAVQPFQLTDIVDGSIIIPPGFALGLQEVGAAGSSPLVAFGMLWEEVPIPA